MSMYNDIVWEEQGNTEYVGHILLKLRIVFADSRADTGHFGDLDQTKNGSEVILKNWMEDGTRLLNKCCSTMQRVAMTPLN